MSSLNLILLKKLVNDIPFYDSKQKNKPFSNSVKEKILKKYRFTCALCGSIDDVNAHHIEPQGSSSVSNGIVLCSMCHTIVHCYLKVFRNYKYVPLWKDQYSSFDNQLSLFMNVVNQEFIDVRRQINDLKKELK